MRYVPDGWLECDSQFSVSLLGQSHARYLLCCVRTYSAWDHRAVPIQSWTTRGRTRTITHFWNLLQKLSCLAAVMFVLWQESLAYHWNWPWQVTRFCDPNSVYLQEISNWTNTTEIQDRKGHWNGQIWLWVLWSVLYEVKWSGSDWNQSQTTMPHVDACFARRFARPSGARRPRVVLVEEACVRPLKNEYCSWESGECRCLCNFLGCQLVRHVC